MLIQKGGVSRNIDEKRLHEYKAKGYTPAKEPEQKAAPKKPAKEPEQK